MSSQSLYRKWRPQTFADLKGQDIIRDTIFYALTHGEMCQAYLFCGPRGTGKTTTARLIAKSVNCLTDTPERPCNQCASCTTITQGTNLDVIEIDAASNRGIDEIRQLRDAVRFAPTQAKYKIFIIDEVHMLTREAFNALLKTLEEPPAHTIFILATTEAHKIPPTIVSRCQRYDFRLAEEATLTKHLMGVAKQETINLHEDAANFLSRLADGSFRDALSLLDQVRVAGKDAYTLSVVEELFGYVPQDQIEHCLAAVLSGNIAEAHSDIDAAMARGASIAAFSSQLLVLSQRVLEAAAIGRFDGFSASLAQVSQSLRLAALIHWVELLLEAIHQMKQCPLPRLPIDVAIGKFASEYAPSKRPEVKEIHVVAAPAPAIAPASVPAATEQVKVAKAMLVKQTEKQEDHELPVESTVTPDTVRVPVAETVPAAVRSEDWQTILKELKNEAPSLVTSLAHARVNGLEDNMLKVAVRYKMHAEKINQPRNRQKIEAVLERVLQSPLKIEALVVKDLVIEEETADISEIFDFEE